MGSLLRPDELTRREREVLDLLRLGLTNEEIAGRLGISLDGAKYHVSQILSKLGVGSREEAAALAPVEARPSWRRVLGWSLAAKLAGAAVVLAAAAGLGVLAWGVLRTSDSGGAPGDLPPFFPSNELARDLALLRAAGSIDGDIVNIEGGLTTWSAAKSAAGDTGMSTHEPAADAPTWFFRFRGMLSPLAGAASGGPAPIPPETRVEPTLSCRDVIVFFAVAPVPEGPTLSLSNGPAAGDCLAVTPISREIALVYASRTAFWRGDQPPTSAAEFTTLTDATSRLAIQLDGSPATPVWLVTLTGSFFEPAPSSPAPGTPPPSPAAHCARQTVIVDANSGEVIHQTSVPSTSCS